MMNPTKFGLLNLDTPSSRYEFLKHVFKSMKKQEKQRTHRLIDGGRGQRGPLISETEAGDRD